jgi:hypothetical protein
MARTRFSYHMLEIVQRAALAGVESNADIALLIEDAFGFPVTATDIARWRRDVWQFDRACRVALMKVTVEIASKAVEMARDGDPQMIRYFLDRRCDAFMPKSKQEHSGTLLDDVLKRRAMSDDEAVDKGLIEEVDDEYADTRQIGAR